MYARAFYIFVKCFVLLCFVEAAQNGFVLVE